MKKTVAALRALTPNPGGIAPRPARKKQIIITGTLKPAAIQ